MEGMGITAGYECCKCFINQIDKVIKIAGKGIDEKKKIEIFKKSIEFLSKLEFSVTPPEIAQQIYSYLNFLLKNDDPFKEIKDKTNELALNIAKEIFSEELSLKEALKYAICGNVIDFGIGDKNFSFSEIKNINFLIFEFEKFYEFLKKTKQLLYIVDNSGEIIFDRLLISIIKKNFPDIRIIVAGREKPVINDITYEELYKLKFNEFSEIISTGFSGPGVPLNKVSDDFKNVFKSSDLIISKGQGNFETLWNLKKENIFFGLKIKCEHVSKATKIPVGSNIFTNF